MPAGKLEENESLIDAAIREVKEETNIDVEIDGLIAIHEKITELGQLIIFYLAASYVGSEISVSRPDEISNVKWLTIDEMKSIDKKDIRGGEIIDDIMGISNKEYIPLDRLFIENYLNQ